MRRTRAGFCGLGMRFSCLVPQLGCVNICGTLPLAPSPTVSLCSASVVASCVMSCSVVSGFGRARVEERDQIFQKAYPPRPRGLEQTTAKTPKLGNTRWRCLYKAVGSRANSAMHETYSRLGPPSVWLANFRFDILTLAQWKHQRTIRVPFLSLGQGGGVIFGRKLWSNGVWLGYKSLLAMRRCLFRESSWDEGARAPALLTEGGRVERAAIRAKWRERQSNGSVLKKDLAQAAPAKQEPLPTGLGAASGVQHHIRSGQSPGDGLVLWGQSR